MKRVVVTSMNIFFALTICSILCLQASYASVQLICPENVHVECGTDLSDLDQFGQAFIHGYGDPYPAPSPSVHFHLNDCGVGIVKRTWVYFGSCGFVFSCSQIIYVTGGGFGLKDITWPEDYMTSDCNASLSPDNLPPGFDKPKVDDVDCGKPAIGFKDWVFHKGSSGCKKVLREWTVIDWCVYDPNSYFPKGIWKHTQVLKIKVMETPDLNCPDEVIVSTSPFSCDGAEVVNFFADGTGPCGGDLVISNNSPFSANGANASGFYPLGETVVTFSGDDGCGNKAQCQTLVIVKDEIAPSPVCIHGLSSTLSHHSDGFYLDLKAEWFNRNSFDNCTSKEDLRFEVFPERVDCDDIGEVEVILTVIDESGNSDFCVTYIRITDNYGFCPAMDSLIVGGSIRTVDGSTIDDGFVFLSDPEGGLIGSSFINDGNYQFIGLQTSSSYQIQPICDSDPLSGVSTFDILLLQMYIMGLWEPDNPLQLISADVDFSGQIDVLDLVHIRNLILGRSTGFPSGQSLRFVDADYQFFNRELPFEDDMPNKVVIDQLLENELAVDFTAFKLGDLNSSFNLSNNGAENRSDLQVTEFPVSYSKKGDVYILSVEMPYSGPLLGLQFGLKMSEDINLLGVNSSVFNGNEFDHSNGYNGELRLSASSPLNYELKEGEVIFEIILDEKLVHFNPIPGLTNEFYMNMDGAQALSFVLKDESERSNLSNSELFASVFPNPVSDGVLNVRLFDLQSSNEIEYTVFSINGQLQSTGNFEFFGGSNELFELNVENFIPGIYFLNLSTVEWSYNLRFVVVD